MNEIKPLTSLRGLAAFLVFMYHYAYLFPPATRGVTDAQEWVPFLPVWQQGQAGVSIFFVLSGFLITRIYWERFVRRAVPLRTFFVKRIGRIWPLFLVFAAVEHGARLLHGGTPDSTWWVTCTMTQGFFSELRYAGLPTAWSLTVEESFYALAPAIFLAVGTVSRRTPPAATSRARDLLERLGGLCLVIGVLVGSGAVLARVATNMSLDWQGFMTPSDHWLRSTLFGRFPEFAIGAGGAFIHRDPRFTTWITPRRGLWLTLACFAGMGVCMAAKNTGGPLAVLLLTYAIAIQAGLLILALCAPDNAVHRVLSTRPAVFAGQISYGLYLIQLTVMMTPLLRLTDHLDYLRLPILYLLTSACCALSYLVVEVPARRAIVQRWGEQAESHPLPVSRAVPG